MYVSKLWLIIIIIAIAYFVFKYNKQKKLLWIIGRDLYILCIGIKNIAPQVDEWRKKNITEGEGKIIQAIWPAIRRYDYITTHPFFTGNAEAFLKEEGLQQFYSMINERHKNNS